MREQLMFLRFHQSTTDRNTNILYAKAPKAAGMVKNPVAKPSIGITPKRPAMKPPGSPAAQ
jgi:hypothetical protein